ncbi:MAG: DUF4038 domain-containing protein [Deltaproteobacteria bacterium]|nr:DUF4038 domain-containing protein [Deltaproteobacteria bacterium]
MGISKTIPGLALVFLLPSAPACWVAGCSSGTEEDRAGDSGNPKVMDTEDFDAESDSDSHPDGGADAGTSHDAGLQDGAGASDTGNLEDSGREDARVDAGSYDAGSETPDAGSRSGPLVPDPANARWLKWKNGPHTFICGPGDPEGFLYRGARLADGTRDGDQDEIISKLAGTGANGIYFQAVRSHGGDGDSTHNPFVDGDPAKGLSDPILDQWERWFEALDEAGVAMFFFVYDDSARIWDTGGASGADERAFVQGLVGRFSHHRGIVWVVAEEYAERYAPARVSAIAAAIRAADAMHPIGVHKNHGLDFSEFATDPGIDVFAIQYNVDTAGELHAGMQSAWDTAAGRYNLTMSEAANHGSGDSARRKNWAAALGGAYVLVLGMDVASTPVSDLEDCGRLARFMESAGFASMSPHDELSFGATEYVMADPGRDYIVYAAGNGDPGLRGLDAGTYLLRWLDTVTGTEKEEEVTTAAGDRTFTRPGGLGTEVALHIRHLPE